MLVTAVLGVLALAVATPPAAAASPCWRQVINEWVQTDHVSSTYELHCYREAIAHVPEDLRAYSSIVDDILAARQQAARTTVRTLQGRGGSSGSSGSAGSGGSGSTQPDTGDTPNRELFKEAFNKLGPRNSNSVPLPLLILAGLSLLLIAAGGAGLISRRVRARKVPG